MTLRQVYAKNSLLLLVASGCAIMAVLFATYGYDRTWRLWNIPAVSPCFADARAITAGAESHAMGYDPLLNDPRDPWGRRLNYPRIWQLLFLLRIDQQDTIYFGVIFAALFFAGVFLATGKVGQRMAVAMACCIFSPAVLMGLERGNNDLLIFFLLALAIRVIKKSPIATAILIGFAFVLKLYPVVAVSVFLRENKRLFQRIFVAFVFLACAYFAIMHDEIKQILIATPQTPFGSYGLDVAWMQLQLGHHFSGSALLLRVASCATAIFIAAFSAFHGGRRPFVDSTLDGHLDAFRVGASIYIGTFVVIGHNFDYKLMFLLFVIPQIVLWMKSRERWIKRVAAVTFGSIILSLWSMFVGGALAHVRLGAYVDSIIDLAAKGTVFSGLLYLLIYSFPEWVKVLCFRMRSTMKVADGISNGRAAE